MQLDPEKANFSEEDIHKLKITYDQDYLNLSLDEQEATQVCRNQFFKSSIDAN